MLYFIPTPIGNLKDITKRAFELLESSDIIFCEDTRVTKKLLNLLEIEFKDKEFISLHSHNEETLVSKIDINIFDKIVLYLSDAGMPCISDPGAKLVQFAQQNSIKYEVLPGSNAALTAYAASGFSQKEFLFYGFLPHKSKERNIELLQILNNGYNTIIYEAPHRIKKLIKQIAIIDKDRLVFAQKEISKLHQKWYKSDAKSLSQTLESENIKGEWVVVIKGIKKRVSNITKDDILLLDIPKKQKAKLLSKITGEEIKKIYNDLL